MYINNHVFISNDEMEKLIEQNYIDFQIIRTEERERMYYVLTNNTNYKFIYGFMLRLYRNRWNHWMEVEFIQPAFSDGIILHPHSSEKRLISDLHELFGSLLPGRYALIKDLQHVVAGAWISAGDILILD